MHVNMAKRHLQESIARSDRGSAVQRLDCQPLVEYLHTRVVRISQVLVLIVWVVSGVKIGLGRSAWLCMRALWAI
jgi:hypothetical protein